MLNEAERAESRRRAREQFDKEYGSEASSSFPGEPSPHDSLGLFQAAKRKWESDPSLRVEFGDDFARYAAFYRAEAKGLVKILAPGRRA